MSRHNVKKLEKIWKTYETAFAENGVVVVVTQDGRKHHLDVRTAAQRAADLNKTLASPTMPAAQRRKDLDFLDHIIPVIREAAFQSECPKDLRTKIVTNVISGKTAEGRQIPVDSSYEGKIKRLQFRFPTLSIEEIENVCRQMLPLDEKIGIMHTINEDRLMAAVHRMEVRVAREAASGAGKPAE